MINSYVKNHFKHFGMNEISKMAAISQSGFHLAFSNVYWRPALFRWFISSKQYQNLEINKFKHPAETSSFSHLDLGVWVKMAVFFQINMSITCFLSFRVSSYNNRYIFCPDAVINCISVGFLCLPKDTSVAKTLFITSSKFVFHVWTTL